MKSFGKAISEARKSARLTQRDLAASIVREDGGQGISPAYLNDIEHDRRTPSGSHLIREFARTLALDADYLLVLAGGQIPHDIARIAATVDQDTYKDALKLFRTALAKKAQYAKKSRDD